MASCLTNFLAIVLSLSVIRVSALPTPPLDTSPSELAWQAWLLSLKDAPHEQQAPPHIRRITPKSVFIAPDLSPESLPACADGYRADTMGRCVKFVKVDQAAHLDFLLQQLNAMYATTSTDNTGEDQYDYDIEEDTEQHSGPFQLNIPFASPIVADEEIDTDVHVVKKDGQIFKNITETFTIIEKEVISPKINMSNEHPKNATVVEREAVNHTVPGNSSHRETVPELLTDTFHEGRPAGNHTFREEIPAKNHTFLEEIPAKNNTFLKEIPAKNHTFLEEDQTTQYNDTFREQDTISDIPPSRNIAGTVFTNVDQVNEGDNQAGALLEESNDRDKDSLDDPGLLVAHYGKVVPLPDKALVEQNPIEGGVYQEAVTTPQLTVIVAPTNGRFDTVKTTDLKDEIVDELERLKGVNSSKEDGQTVYFNEDTAESGSGLNVETLESPMNDKIESTLKVTKLTEEEIFPELSVYDAANNPSTTEKTIGGARLPNPTEANDPLLHGAILITRLGGGPITDADFSAHPTPASELEKLELSLAEEQLELLKTGRGTPSAKPMRETSEFDYTTATSLKFTRDVESVKTFLEDEELYNKTKLEDTVSSSVSEEEDAIVPNTIRTPPKQANSGIVRFPTEPTHEMRNTGFVKFPDSPARIAPNANTLIPDDFHKKLKEPETPVHHNNEHKPPFWWLPSGWEVDHTRKKPLLLRFWSKTPQGERSSLSTRYEATSQRPTNVRQTSGYRGIGRHPSEQYYREVSAHDVYSILDTDRFRNLHRRR